VVSQQVAFRCGGFQSLAVQCRTALNSNATATTISSVVVISFIQVSSSFPLLFSKSWNENGRLASSSDDFLSDFGDVRFVLRGFDFVSL